MSRVVRRLPPLSRWSVWAATATLLLAGLIGPLHRGLHPGEASPAPAATTATDATAQGGLFVAHDEGGAECRLLDQALQFHGATTATTWLPAALAHTAPAAAVNDLGVASAFAAYRARAPPGIA